ncbi:hypothetical protein Spaf_1910 [Streptococcus parasanguinis FW213]|uniref:Uncharacterized protein n=1 Tax=Streptococcus parasanguinis FW213 TaxID=1114965 RepID=I1ZP79_STRPA|nr:hypothetical protein Spaf_1910 [Streptococcus parasanguinis FW213]
MFSQVSVETRCVSGLHFLSIMLVSSFPHATYL